MRVNFKITGAQRYTFLWIIPPARSSREKGEPDRDGGGGHRKGDRFFAVAAAVFSTEGREKREGGMRNRLREQKNSFGFVAANCKSKKKGLGFDAASCKSKKKGLDLLLQVARAKKRARICRCKLQEQKKGLGFAAANCKSKKKALDLPLQVAREKKGLGFAAANCKSKKKVVDELLQNVADLGGCTAGAIKKFSRFTRSGKTGNLSGLSTGG